MGNTQAIHPMAMKIGKPVFTAMARAQPDYISSDCQLAGHHIEQGMETVREALGGKAPRRAPAQAGPPGLWSVIEAREMRWPSISRDSLMTLEA